MKMTEEEKAVVIHQLLIPIVELNKPIENVKRGIAKVVRLLNEMQNFEDLKALEYLKIVETEVEIIRRSKLLKVINGVDDVITNLGVLKDFLDIENSLGKGKLRLALINSKMGEVLECTDIQDLQEKVDFIVKDIDELIELQENVLTNILQSIGATGDKGLIHLAINLLKTV